MMYQGGDRMTKMVMMLYTFNSSLLKLIDMDLYILSKTANAN